MATWVIKTAADYERAHRAIQEKLNRATKGAEGASLKALTDVSVDCLSRAVERAPVEFGDLRGSGYVSINGAKIAAGQQDGNVVVSEKPETDTAAAGYISDMKKNVAEVGFTAPYAFTQHEHVEFNHPLGGQAKYLESVVVENESRWAKHLAESAKDGFEGGVK